MSRFTKQTLLLIALPLAFLLVLLALSLILEQRDGAVAAESQRSATVLASAERLSSLVGSADRAIGDYAKSRSPQAAQSFHLAVSQLGSTLAEIDRLEPANQLDATFQQAIRVLNEYFSALERRDIAAQHRIDTSPAVRKLSLAIPIRIAAFDRAERLSTLQALNRINKEIQSFTIALIVASILGIGIALVVALRFGVTITQRMQRLAENARRLADGQPAIPLTGNDDIADLDAVYHQMTEVIKSGQHRVAALQQALLPQRLPVFPGLRLDAVYVPAAGESEIGGDWYDVFRISERRIGISIGDVAGHGLRAAAIMGNVRHSIRSFAYFNESPAQVLERVNQVLCRDDNPALVTAFYATLDVLNGTLQYAFAGHPAPLLVRTGGSVEHIPGSGFVLGVEPQTEFVNHALEMEIGSALVLYTDGLVECDGDYFRGVSDLEMAVENEYREASGNIAEAIQRRMLGGRRTTDDCAVVFVGITALGADAIQRESARWTLDARSETSARRVKRAVLWHLGQVADNADLSLPELILSELLGNVARHTPGPAEVTLERNGSEITLRVYDEGPAFEPPSESDAVDLLAEGGRGIFLIREMSGSFSVVRREHGNCVSAVLPLSAHSMLPLAHARQYHAIQNG